jgi:hypothetical protein
MAHELLVSLAVSAGAVWGLPSPVLILFLTALIVDSTTARQLVIALGQLYDRYEQDYQQMLQQHASKDHAVTPRDGQAVAPRVDQAENDTLTVKIMGQARRLSGSLLGRRTL